MADINLPKEIMLPIPESVKEQDLYKTLQEYVKDVNNSFSSIEDIEAITAGTGLTDTSNTFTVNTDNSTIEISANNLQIKDGGITNGKLGADCVDGTKIADDSIDSEHYVAGSIDHEHLADDSVDSNNYVDGSIDTVHIGDKQITSAKLEDDLAFGTFPTTPASAPDADYEVANKKYVNDYVSDNMPSSGFSFISKTSMASSTDSGNISITQGVKYKVVYNLTNSSSGGVTIRLQFNADSGSHYGNSGESSTASDAINISPSIYSNIGEGFGSGSFTMAPVVTDQMLVIGENGYKDSSANIQISDIVGHWNNNVTVTSFKIISSGNISGDILLYKCNEA